MRVQVGFFFVDTRNRLLPWFAYQFGYNLFQDSEETIHIAEMNDISYERAACCHLDEAKINIFQCKKSNIHL